MHILLSVTGFLISVLIIVSAAISSPVQEPVVKLTESVTAAQTFAWNKDKQYLKTDTAIQVAEPSIGEWLLNDRLSKFDITPDGDSISFELGVHNSYIRVLMSNGKVVDVNCQGLTEADCPTVSRLNAATYTVSDSK